MSPAEQRTAFAIALRNFHSMALKEYPALDSLRTHVQVRGAQEINSMTTRRNPDHQHWEPTA